MSRRALSLIWVSCAAALSTACAPVDTPPLPDGGSSGSDSCMEAGPFVAVQSSFNGFQSWPRFDLGADAGGDGLGDVGDRVVYINKVPPHGSTSFPVGTILVKTAGFGTVDAGPTFAMAKHGACFNASGAEGWEWFELQPQPSGSVQVVWRGVQQPAADVYGTAGVSCNSCHSGAAANDYVAAAPLDLTQF